MDANKNTRMVVYLGFVLHNVLFHIIEQAIYFERALIKAIRVEQGLETKANFNKYKNKFRKNKI